MKGILADINTEGHLKQLSFLLHGEEWKELWAGLNISLYVFSDFDLPLNASDLIIWQTSQKEELVLVTNNRNADGPDSLEETIRAYNSITSLSVFTIADIDKLHHSRDYAERVVERMLEYLLDIDSYRGTGRLFLP